MERAINLIRDLKLEVVESWAMESDLPGVIVKDICKSLKEVEEEIEALNKDQAALIIPKLPSGQGWNCYPRFLYALIFEKYSKDEYFTISELADLTGASRNQVRNDLDRLEYEGFIKNIGTYKKGKTNFFKYEPIEG